MTTFHPQQSDRGRRVQKMANARTLQIHVTNCTTKLNAQVHEARKIRRNNVQRTVQAHITKLSFYTSSGKEAALLPLPPLRTGRESFPSSGSSRSKAPYYGAGSFDGFNPASRR